MWAISRLSATAVPSTSICRTGSGCRFFIASRSNTGSWAFGSNQTTAELAPDQLAAVLHPGGGARIIAPAGSGKTRVLTERARLLLTGWHLPANAIAVVAFNRRAADELKNRTPDLPELRVRTLNALGLRLFRNGVRTIEEAEVQRPARHPGGPAEKGGDRSGGPLDRSARSGSPRASSIPRSGHGRSARCRRPR